MHRIHYLFFYILISPLCFAQTDSLKISQNEAQITQLESRVQYLNRSLNAQNQQFKNLQNQLARLSLNTDSLDRHLEGELESFTAEMESFQATQAQTERALNLALDDLRQKFEDQNRNAAKMQATLESKVNSELLYAAITGFALILLFIVFNRISLNRGLKTNLANWNQFQDHFLKNQSR